MNTIQELDKEGFVRGTKVTERALAEYYFKAEILRDAKISKFFNEDYKRNLQKSLDKSRKV